MDYVRKLQIQPVIYVHGHCTDGKNCQIVFNIYLVDETHVKRDYKAVSMPESLRGRKT